MSGPHTATIATSATLRQLRDDTHLILDGEVRVYRRESLTGKPHLTTCTGAQSPSSTHWRVRVQAHDARLVFLPSLHFGVFSVYKTEPIHHFRQSSLAVTE